MKDWTGNYKSIYTTLGASNHTSNKREDNDYYATEPKAIELLLLEEEFDDNIWECACGELHLSDVSTKSGYHVRNSDIINRTNREDIEVIDFLNCNEKWNGDIITNPPYKYAKEFVEKALNLIEDNHKVAMFLKLQFLEGKARREMFDKYPPRTIYVASSRLLCAKNGEFDKYESSAIAYAWFVWEKGFVGNPTVKWIN